MKRWILAVAALTILTGCGGAQTTNNAPSNQTATPPLGNAVGDTGNTATANSTANDTGSTTDAQETANEKQVAHDLIERYILSHNDKSLAEYKVDVQQFFTPGMANLIGGAAQSGVDFNHPVSSYTIDVKTVGQPNQQQLRATAMVVIHFKNGTTDQHLRHILAVNSGDQWYLQTIA